jgi:hypothetical protein
MEERKIKWELNCGWMQLNELRQLGFSVQDSKFLNFFTTNLTSNLNPTKLKPCRYDISIDPVPLYYFGFWLLTGIGINKPDASVIIRQICIHSRFKITK